VPDPLGPSLQIRQPNPRFDAFLRREIDYPAQQL
jgi:hypothetical protein